MTRASAAPASAWGLTNSANTFLVNRLAAAIDMIAAGTSAPITTAANDIPANQPGKVALHRSGTASGVLPPALTARGYALAGEGHVTEQRDQPEHERIGRQQRACSA